MNQFKMLCGLMGLRRTYGDVRQHIWLDVRDEGPGKEDTREMWIKLGGHKPLIRQSWCGPLKFSVPTNDRWRGNQDREKNKWTVNLTGKEPPCMSGLRVKQAQERQVQIHRERKEDERPRIDQAAQHRRLGARGPVVQPLQSRGQRVQDPRMEQETAVLPGPLRSWR